MKPLWTALATMLSTSSRPWPKVFGEGRQPQALLSPPGVSYYDDTMCSTQSRRGLESPVRVIYHLGKSRHDSLGETRHSASVSHLGERVFEFHRDPVAIRMSRCKLYRSLHALVSPEGAVLRAKNKNLLKCSPPLKPPRSSSRRHNRQSTRASHVKFVVHVSCVGPAMQFGAAHLEHQVGAGRVSRVLEGQHDEAPRKFRPRRRAGDGRCEYLREGSVETGSCPVRRPLGGPCLRARRRGRGAAQDEAARRVLSTRVCALLTCIGNVRKRARRSSGAVRGWQTRCARDSRRSAPLTSD